MTEIKKSTENDRRLSAGQIAFCLMSATVLVLTFLRSEVVISSMSDGMKICAKTIIPALFPFMVLSELLVSSGAADIVARALGGVFQRLFGIRREGSIALIMGVICGFPIGAKSALSLYQGGKISRSELEHLLCFCNGPSSAFLISAVGISLFGSRQFGILLYAADTVSAIAIGVAARVFFKHKSPCSPSCTPPKQSSCEYQTPTKITVRAISSSAVSMLSVCAFITFFSAMIGMIRSYAQSLGIRGSALSLILGAFEMTSGIATSSSLEPLDAAICSAAIVGWSGLSVHFQLMGIFVETKISFCAYFISKALRAFLNVIWVVIGLEVWSESIVLFPSSSPSFLNSHVTHPIHVISLATFCAAVICISFGIKRKNRSTRWES